MLLMMAGFLHERGCSWGLDYAGRFVLEKGNKVVLGQADIAERGSREGVDLYTLEEV